ncbi:hypothetical protein K503DRAFT_866864 [Rhizopogon vinicolor AM-OR11-026]|uniref:L-Lysine epsilon oxidase N-terminal domain-containing protein n=1 Tax=Rhizopogon vinicolor AM-OR11-026 TaxID=1314800 RepID=A0A1B7MXX1_9AGAM|nr:hypothetical protein K503DRAFT_866864 [Rhizopogon vinicolor AM-OR11-026]
MTSTVNPNDIEYVQIFPPIGIARLGDFGFDLSTGQPEGTLEWFLPSEIPGTEETLDPKGKLRDGKNRTKRQAVQFRVYAYRADGTILGGITSGGDYEYTLNWTGESGRVAFEIHQNFLLNINQKAQTWFATGRSSGLWRKILVQ